MSPVLSMPVDMGDFGGLVAGSLVGVMGNLSYGLLLLPFLGHDVSCIMCVRLSRSVFSTINLQRTRQSSMNNN